MKIKKGDHVVVLTGKDRGRSGMVLRSLPTDNKVVIEGVNIAKRHEKARKAGEAAQIRDVEMPVHVSNVAVLGTNGKAAKVGFKLQADGSKVRIDKRTGGEL